MINHAVARILLAGGVAGGVLFSELAAAIDWNFTGLFRQEIAYSIAGNNNEMNSMGSVFNDRIVPHYTNASFNAGNAAAPARANPASLFAFGTTPRAAGTFGATTRFAGANTLSPVNCRFGNLNAIQAGSSGLAGDGGFRGVLCPNGGGTSYVPGANPAAGAGFSPQGAGLNDDINFNLFNTRVELDLQARFNNHFAAFVKFRAYYDGTPKFTDGQLGDPYENPFWGTRATATEWNSPSFVVDLPMADIDYNVGRLWIRVGHQVIAWGEAYFFRVMDVANGLDLRRHLTLGPGGEEFQDQRVASPGIRLNYTFRNDWEIEAFAQLFSPTILPAANTPYNLISATFTLDERDEYDDAEFAINFGARLSAPVTERLTLLAMYANRRNPGGVFRFAEAPLFNGGTQNRFCAGAFNDTNNLLNTLGLQGLRAARGIPAMPALSPGTKTLNHCGSAVAPDPIAASSTEFFHLVSRSRLDPMKVARVVVDEWPATAWATRDIFGFGQEFNVVDALSTLEGFHSLLGGFRGWATREFKREHIFAVGGNYIVNADPLSFWDQLIIRGEVAVTPHKKFTDLGLSFKFIEETEVVSALIFEKLHRWTADFPSIYMVAQWMHRTESDLFGRHLSGTESVPLSKFLDPATGDFTPSAFVDGAASPKGSDAADYVVFAFQQPFPNLRWRVDLSILVDVEGGYLVQPGLRFRPSASWQWDLYANLIEDGGDENDDIMETLDFADEIFARLTYYF